MNQWTLTSSPCGRDFRYSSIPENPPFAGSYSPHKPEFCSSRLTLDSPQSLTHVTISGNVGFQPNEFTIHGVNNLVSSRRPGANTVGR